MVKIFGGLLLISQLMVLVSCSDNDDVSTDPNATDSQFVDTVWSMIEYTNSDGAQSPLLEGTPYAFKAITEGTELQALADCNFSTKGSYQLNDGSVTLEFGAFSESACEDSPDTVYIQQDETLIELLFGSSNNPIMYSIVDGKLVLSLADGRNMTFENLEDFPEIQ